MKLISYIFTIPACILFYIAEKIRGEKIGWRYKEVFNDKKIITKCSKCGHKGNLEIIKKQWDIYT